MNSIDLMVEEHKYATRMLKVIRSACYTIFQGEEIDYEDFGKMIDFVRSYVDKHHHGKEEKLLFKEMQNHLGKIADNLITHGMLVEHDLGRLYMSDLEEALERVKNGDEESKLDVISNAVGYTHLLTRHIAKEDEVVYSFGAKNLPQEIIEDINKKTEAFEKEAEDKGTQAYYKTMLEELESKYGS